MASFRQKKITRIETLADKLKQARIKLGISLDDAQTATNIQLKYLEILEEGNYQKLPGDIYAKAWLKLYGNFLGLDVNELLADYKIEKRISDKLLKVTKEPVKESEPAINILTPRKLKLAAISLLVLALLGYLGWEVNNIITPPEVNIVEPENNFRTIESSIVVKGQTRPEVQLTINNELVLLDAEGNFSQTINLVPGLNNLAISAKKKHSKVNNLELVILREDS